MAVRQPLPTTPPSIHARFTARAKLSAANLAALLHVSQATLEQWLEGEKIPPTSIFLACVDIALENKS